MITLWDTTTGQSLAKLSADGTKHLAFSADGWMFAAVGQDGRYRVWEAATADELVAYTPQHPDGFSYRFTPDFDQLVIGTKLGKLEFVEVATGKNHRSINAVGLGAITATAFSSQKTFLTATGFPSNGIRFWDLSTGEPSQKLKNLAPHSSTPRSLYQELRFSPDDRYLASMSDQLGLTLYDLSNSMPRNVEQCNRPGSLIFTPDGRQLIYLTTRDEKPEIVWIEIATGEVAHRMFTAHSQSRGLHALCFRDRELTAAILLEHGLVVQTIDRPEIPSQPDLLQIENTEVAWQMLGSRDATAGTTIMTTLVEAEDRGVDWIRAKLEAPSFTSKFSIRVNQLIQALGHERYTVRAKAMRSLQQMGPLAGPVMQRALARNPDPETARRLERLLALIPDSLWGLNGNTLCLVRLVAVLETIGTTEAVDLLEQIAKQNPDTRVLQETKASLQRFKFQGAQ